VLLKETQARESEKEREREREEEREREIFVSDFTVLLEYAQV